MGTLNEMFENIYLENYPRVFSFVYNITTDWSLTEDITQETFLKAYKNMDSFRGESQITVWLNKIAYNILLDTKKKKSLNLLPVDDGLLTVKLTDLKKNLAQEIEQKLMSECIRSKILVIPENYRAPLFLDVLGYDNQEIANVLGCTLENAKIRLHRARKKMKEILGQDCSLYYDERNVLC